MASDALLAALETLRRTGGKTLKVTQPLAEQRAEVVAKAAAQRFDPSIRFEEIDISGLRAVWVIPPGAATDRVLLFFHGGAYAKGPLEASHGALLGHCTALGARALSVDYRLAPEHPYPAALDDARKAYAHLLEAGYDPDRIVAIGSSAGGGLALALVLACRNAGIAQPAAAVLISPWGDLTNSGESVTTREDRDPLLSRPYLDRFAALYAGGEDPMLPTISPVFDDYHGVATAILAQVGSEEVLFDDARRIVERAERAGVSAKLEEYEMGFHGWQNGGVGVPEAGEAYRSAADFVRRHARGA